MNKPTLLFLLSLWFVSGCKPANNQAEVKCKKLSLPDDRFYVYNFLNEAPIVLPITYTPYIDSTATVCRYILDGDDKPLEWVHDFYSYYHKVCIHIEKGTLPTKFDSCNTNDSSHMRKWVNFLKGDGVEVFDPQCITVCEKDFAVKANWMNFISPDKKIRGVHAFIAITDYKRKSYYMIEYNRRLSSTPFKLEDIEAMIKSNVELLEVYYDRQ